MVIVIGVIAGTLWLFLDKAERALPGPTDGSLIEDFDDHRVQYKELLQMFQKDVALYRVEGSDDWSEPPTVDGIDEARLRQYIRLCQELHVQWIERRDDPGKVYFVVGAYGLVPSGIEKGYVYSPLPPSPLVKDTDDGSEESAEEVYRSIDGGWYVWRGWW